MTFTLVVGAASAPDIAFYEALLAEAERVVAADAAAEWCVEHGRVPDIAVGDFDGSRPGATERLAGLGVEVIPYDPDKDRTDLELAAECARERFALPVVLTAAFTDRLDHTLAGLGVLMKAGPSCTVREPGWSAVVCVPGAASRLHCRPGQTFSVLAPGGAEGVSVTGAKWPLTDARLLPFSGVGVSNVSVGTCVEVSVSTGTLILILQQDDT
jgi:thiamine pyrophosphokinase